MLSAKVQASEAALNVRKRDVIEAPSSEMVTMISK